MNRHTVFADADPDRVAHIAEALGARFSASTALGVPQLVRDPAVSSADLSDGILRAHLLGAISVLVAAREALPLDDPDRYDLVDRATRLWMALLSASTQ